MDSCQALFFRTSDGIAGGGGKKGLRFFLPFYPFTLLPLKGLSIATFTFGWTASR